MSRVPIAPLAAVFIGACVLAGCDKSTEATPSANAATAEKPEAQKSESKTAAKPEDTDEKPPQMKVELVQTPDTPEGRAGLAVTFEIEDGWHIYWTNPGEAGLPTRVKLSGPNSAAFSPIAYPLPETFVAPGDIESFGYGHRTALFSSVSGVNPGDVIEAKASWLVCKSSCIKQNKKLSLTLSDRKNESFEDLRKRLPASLGAPEAPKSVAEWTADEQGATLVLTFPDEAPKRFIPELADPFILESQKLEGDILKLKWRRAATTTPTGAQGLLVFGDEAQPRPYTLALDWPAAS